MPRRSKPKPSPPKALWQSINLRIYALGLLILGVVGLIIGFGLSRHLVNPTVDYSNRVFTKLPAEFKPPASSSAKVRVPILLYHYVEYVKDQSDKIRISLNTPPHILDNQIQGLKKQGYTFLTMNEVGQVLDGYTKLPDKPVVLTFDDGYRDFYTDVLPILKKYQVKAVVYIVPDFINGPNSMSEAQLEEVSRSGLVEIGAHTMDHLYLRGLKQETVKYQVLQSKLVLEKETGRPVVSFAYPYGAFDEQATEIVRQAGFKTAVSTIPGIEVSQNNRFFIYRIRPGYRSGDELARYLEQASFK